MGSLIEEWKAGNVRLWLNEENAGYSVSFYHANFPIPVDKETGLTKSEAEEICRSYIAAYQKDPLI